MYTRSEEKDCTSKGSFLENWRTPKRKYEHKVKIETHKVLCVFSASICSGDVNILYKNKEKDKGI